MSGPAPGLEIAWREGAEAPALRAEWLELMARTGADVCFDPDWLSAWAAGPGRGTRILLMEARENGRLAALLPFALTRVGPLRTRIARPAGTDPLAPLMRLPAEEAAAAPALAAALARLLGAEGCAGVSFSPVSEALGTHDALAEAARTADADLMQAPAGVHTLFRLPESFEAYLAGLSKKRRNLFRRELRQLGETRALDSRAIAPSAQDFDAFRALHDRQWRAAGRPGHFGDWPDAAAFHRALTGTLAPRGVMRLDRLSDEAGPIAEQLLYVSGGVAWWRLPARRLDPDTEKLGAGRIGLVLMLERLIGEGVRLVEGGAGDYDYKKTWGGEAVPLRRMIAHRPGPAPGLRVLLAWADLLHLAYYRVWVLKLAPRLSQRLGQRRRPLWRAWIRSRI